VIITLTIYRKKPDIPEGIKLVRDNDAYFDAKTKLRDTALERLILKKIDYAKYNSDNTFIGREEKLGALNKNLLSTGTKTLLNIISSDHVCFDVVECGTNALDLLPKLSLENINGYILWESCMYPFSDNYACDIMYKGRHFKQVYDFMELINEEGSL
jgi:hypothetical protein